MVIRNNRIDNELSKKKKKKKKKKMQIHTFFHSDHQIIEIFFFFFFFFFFGYQTKEYLRLKTTNNKKPTKKKKKKKMPLSHEIKKAGEAILKSKGLIITSGAGMGVDSGLPDFRGNEGLWNYYPPLRHLNVSFSSMANPSWFDKDPELAWGFYGHRLQLYRNTVPNEGFFLLKKWGESLHGGNYFAFTSNVDGQFQKAGFPDDNIMECHGSIHYLQSVSGGRGVEDIVSAPQDVKLDIDMRTLRVNTTKTPLPQVGGCLARPNILMFSDLHWISGRTDLQESRFNDFLTKMKGEKVVVVEIGAGMAVPTIRMLGEQLKWTMDATLVRINPRECEGGDIEIPLSGLECLRQIDDYIQQNSK